MAGAGDRPGPSHFRRLLVQAPVANLGLLAAVAIAGENEMTELNDWVCQKTGAEVWLEQYGCYVRGDMYRMGDYHILRVNNNTFQSSPAPGILHYSVRTILQYFDKNDGGTGTMMLRDVEYHGYKGLLNFASGPHKPPVLNQPREV